MQGGGVEGGGVEGGGCFAKAFNKTWKHKKTDICNQSTFLIFTRIVLTGQLFENLQRQLNISFFLSAFSGTQNDRMPHRVLIKFALNQNRNPSSPVAVS